VCRVQRVVALAGYICAGKSTLAAAYCARHPGARTLLISELLKKMMEDQGLPTKPRSRISAFYMLTLEERGEGFLAKMVLDHVRGNPADLYLLDGWRRIEQHTLMTASPEVSFLGVFIEAPPQVMFDRWVRRARAGDGPDFSREAFMAQKMLPSENEIPDLIRLSMIVMDGSQPRDVVLSRFEQYLQNESF